ncbi:MAG: serine/threonine-protein kinase, partial [Myxococcota bacterium]|nr:serine/threonine-protein kinase [Myxococcota bacterium]
MDVGTLLASRFRILRTLGKGGMSTVYEALDTRVDRHVALKIIRRPEGFSLLRFKEEFRALGELRHPNLIELYDFARDEETWFFTMELIEGVDLVAYLDGVRASESAYLASMESAVGDRVSGERVTPTREIFRVMAEIGAAVAYLHEQGTIHRDLKPSNILIDGRARPRILDFGIARFLTAPEEVKRALNTRKVGTPGYVAPEQINGRAVPASDMYSMGVILYRLLTGKLPFRGRKKEVLRAHLAEIPVSPVEIQPSADPFLAELALRLLDKDPTRRPSPGELAQITRPEHEQEYHGFRPVAPAEQDTPLVGR